MRLIDADALANALFDKRKNYPQWVADTIGEMPDAIVRCKDCKHSTVSESGLIKCGHVFRMADFFCADGERKSD